MNARVGLSIRLGVMGGFIWGIFFAAYYSMLPSYKFALCASTLCFVVIVAVLLLLPSIITNFKNMIKEETKKGEEEHEE